MDIELNVSELNCRQIRFLGEMIELYEKICGKKLKDWTEEDRRDFTEVTISLFEVFEEQRLRDLESLN